MQVHITTNMCKLPCIMLQTKPQRLRLNHSKKVKNHTLNFTNAETPKQLNSCVMNCEKWHRNDHSCNPFDAMPQKKNF